MHTLPFPLCIVLFFSACIDAVNHSKNKNAIVVASDAHMIPCALTSLKGLKDNGHFDGPVYLLAPSTANFDTIVIDSLTSMNVSVIKMPMWTKYTYHGSSMAYQRLHIFTSIFFRRFDVVVYFDADSVVQANVSPLFTLVRPHIQVIMRDNGIGIGKGALCANEFRSAVPVDDTPSPGSSCFMIINMRALPPPSVLHHTFQKTLDMYHKAFKFADQSLLNLVFRKGYMVIWPCVHDMRVIGPDESIPPTRGWAYNICKQSDLIIYHDWKKNCMQSM